MVEEIRNRRLSPVELVEAHLREIETRNSGLNAFVTVLAEQARAEARAAQEGLDRGAAPGALHGVPVTIKDSLDVAGLPTLCGSRLRLDHRAGRDAAVVRRLRDAGAIVLGKTNCPEMLANYESDNHIIGRTNNPWNPERTAGGSSGGEAAAIAGFCSAGGIGSDGGGSIRVPAHFCGIAGLKPTPGRVSGAGHFPPTCHPGGLLGVVGPMARSARDLEALFRVVAGFDGEDPFSAPVPVRKPELAGLRVGVMEQFHRVPVEPVMREAVRKAAAALSGLGLAVDAFTPRGLERAPNLWAFFFVELAAVAQREMFAGREEELHWTGREFFDSVRDHPDPTAKTILENLAARDAMRAALLAQMEEWPVLLAPACGVVAFPHRQRRWTLAEKSIGLFEAMMPLTWVNLLGLPSLVIPVTRDPQGLPAGIQLIGRPWEEELLLELGVRLEEARGPFPRP